MDTRCESRARPPGLTFHVFCRALLLGGGGFAVFGGIGPVTQAAGVAGILLAVLADFDGLIRHGLRAMSLVAALYAASLFGGSLGAWLSTRSGLPAPAGNACGLAAAAVGTMLMVGLCGRLLGRAVRRSRFARLDRAAGAMLGFAEGVAVVAAACWSVATFAPQLDSIKARSESSPWMKPMFAAVDAFRGAMARDPFAQVALEHNPLPDMPFVRATQQIVSVATDPEKVEQLSRSEALREFTELPAVKRHLDAMREDSGLRQAVEQRDLFAIMGSPQFAAMLSDGELHAALASNYSKIQAALTEIEPARTPAPQPDGPRQATGGARSRSNRPRPSN